MTREVENKELPFVVERWLRRWPEQKKSSADWQLLAERTERRLQETTGIVDEIKDAEFAAQMPEQDWLAPPQFEESSAIDSAAPAERASQGGLMKVARSKTTSAKLFGWQGGVLAAAAAAVTLWLGLGGGKAEDFGAQQTFSAPTLNSTPRLEHTASTGPFPVASTRSIAEARSAAASTSTDRNTYLGIKPETLARAEDSSEARELARRRLTVRSVTKPQRKPSRTPVSPPPDGAASIHAADDNNTVEDGTLVPAAHHRGLAMEPSLGALQAALAIPLQRARRCLTKSEPAIPVRLKFSSSGRVNEVKLLKPIANSARKCVEITLAVAQVAPFAKSSIHFRTTVRP